VNETIQASTQNASNDPDQLGLQENMPYEKARNLLIQQGWQPNLQGDPPNLNDTTVRELFDLGYKEVKDCAGTGLGPCLFEFTNEAGEQLNVSTIQNGSGNNRERFVWHWDLETNSDSRQQESSEASNEEASKPELHSEPSIMNGFYILGGTDQGLEVSGDQYRYYDEMGTQEWKPISELTSISNGIVFDGKNYWCIPTKEEAGVCTEHGWRSVQEGLSEQGNSE
jgi:hypothetical protein